MYFFAAGSGLEVCEFDGFYESAEFGYFLDVVVHFLVGYYGEDQISGISCMGVFGENRFCPGIERDDEGVVGLLGIDTYLVVLDVGVGQFCHVAVTKAGVCAEAEHVSGAVEARGEGDGLFIFLTLDVDEFDFCSFFRYDVVVEDPEFVLGQEHDCLVDDLELWHVVLEVIGNGIVFLLGPAEEPFEEFDVFLD